MWHSGYNPQTLLTDTEWDEGWTEGGGGGEQHGGGRKYEIKGLLRKKERTKERKKKTVPHSDKKLNKRKMAERGRLGAPVGRARSSLLISLMFYLCICIIPVINSCKVIGWLRVGSQSINLYICESIQLGSLLPLKPCKPQITAYYNS